MPCLHFKLCSECYKICQLPILQLLPLESRGMLGSGMVFTWSWAMRFIPMCCMQVCACSASRMQPDEVVDTTGAGDAYIASLMYGLLHDKSVPDMMRLGSVVSAAKCTALGARPGLPKREQLDASLL